MLHFAAELQMEFNIVQVLVNIPNSDPMKEKQVIDEVAADSCFKSQKSKLLAQTPAVMTGSGLLLPFMSTGFSLARTH